MISRAILSSSLLLLCLFVLPKVHAQLGKITIDLAKDKPQKFKEQTLRSEKTGDKKFTVPRRFVQNTVSHYNYFYNANNKIKQVIERARVSNKDDYSKLLPFYSYSLDNTASQKNDLDSVIYKATTGILIHDLRTNWVDNFYLLIGEAYYLRKDFDSAAMTFQFINYNLYPHKRKDDDQLIVGSNLNGPSSGIAVASKESKKLVDKVFMRPPSRNDALIWQAKAQIGMNELSDAAALINTLQNDPNLPARLKPDLEEVTAYWFYNQQMYDSTLVHLLNAMPSAIDEADQARREFLIAQLCELTNKQDTASTYYDYAMHHTTDPLMDIYANLNKATMLRSNDPAEIDKSIANLVQMSKKDRFEDYRDIIFFAAAKLALIKPDTASTITFLKKSTHYNQDNVELKNKAFLKIAEISYSQKKYKEAYAAYDSLQLTDTSLTNIPDIEKRKSALAVIVNYLNAIEREDSLQAIAAMPAAERDAFLKKLSKRLQKEAGIKNDTVSNYTLSNRYDSKYTSTDAFGNTTTANGEWYFYNRTLKSQGFNDFKRIWGKRQNVDNWRRGSAASSSLAANSFGNPDDAEEDAKTGVESNKNAPKLEGGGYMPPVVPEQRDLSVDGLLANVPTTKQKLDTSNTIIARSLFELGKNYQTKLEDYYAAIDAYTKSLTRFPDSLYAGELYLNLSFCYRKIGDNEKADYYKNLLVTKFDKSKFTQLALHPEGMEPLKKDSAATLRYEQIYNSFIEGDFEKAVSDKKKADSIYGPNYWSPQLLYIQSVYYIKKKEDSTAISLLNQIVTQYASSPLKDKAVTMIDVLKRRKQIEAYLTNLKVERLKEDSDIFVYDNPTLINQTKDTSARAQTIVQRQTKVIPQKIYLDSSKQAPPVSNGTFMIDPLSTQSVMMVLTKVDPVYISEAKNALTRYATANFYSQHIIVTRDTLDKERTLILFSEFLTADDAIKFAGKIKHDAPSEISWLPAAKYSFYIISGANLELLKQNKKLDNYLDLLNKKFPGKFEISQPAQK